GGRRHRLVRPAVTARTHSFSQRKEPMTSPQGHPPGPPREPDPLVIGAGDIDHTIPVEGPRHAAPAGGALPSVSSPPTSTGSTSAQPSWLGNTSVTAGLISGAVGGLGGALLQEVIGFDNWIADTETEAK